MADDFHAYREWLGLSNRTPDYYELLSLAADVGDPQQIATAAERATTKVRSFRPGPHARAWSQLLDEIQAAKECLCVPVRRAEYDAKRRDANAAATTSETAPPSALAAISNELYPPGMSRPTSAAQPTTSTSAPKQTNAQPTRSDLDPPMRQPAAASEDDSTPDFTEAFSDESLPPAAALQLPAPSMAVATPLAQPLAGQLPMAAMPMAISVGHAAAAYPTALPLGTPAAMPDRMLPYGNPPAGHAGLPQLPTTGDPMLPAPIDVMLPPGATPQGSTVATGMGVARTVAPHSPAADLRMQTAPSATRFAEQRSRQAQRGLILTIAGCLALVAVAAGAYWFGTRRTQSEPVVVAETPHPEPTADPPRFAPSRSEAPRPETKMPTPRPDVMPAPVIPALAPSPTPAPESVAPTPTPVIPPTAPSPTPAPAPEPPPPPPVVTKAEVQALIKALDAAKTALGEQNFKAADAHLTRAQSLAKLPKHQEAVARLKQVGEHVQQFRQAVADAVKGMQAGETFKVGNSTQVSFIEGFSDKVIVRIAGMNRTYPFNDMPPGLALALADFKLPNSSASSRVTKGAYLLVHKRADDKEEEKAGSLWEEAQASGVDLSRLMPFLKDNYAEFLQDATTM